MVLASTPFRVPQARRIARHQLADSEQRSASTNALKQERKIIGGRRHAYDEAFHNELASGLIEKGRALTGGAESKVQGVDKRRVGRWSVDVLGRQCVCSRCVLCYFNGAFCLSEDAANLGKLAQATRTYSLFCAELGVGVWLVSQATALPFFHGQG